MGSPYSPDFPKSTIAAGPRTTHYAAQGRRANIVFSLEREREEEKRWVLAATSAPPAGSACIRYKEARAQQGTSVLYVCVNRYVYVFSARVALLKGCRKTTLSRYMGLRFFVFERKRASELAYDALV